LQTTHIIDKRKTETARRCCSMLVDLESLVH